LFILTVLWSSYLFAQTADFSGEWVQDNSKSDPYYRDYNVKLTITQTPQAILIKTTFTDKNGRESSSEESFTLDGKEIKKEEYGGINAESTSWSGDNQILTTKTTRTVGSEVYGSTSTYTMSDNGHTLTILTEDIKPGQPSLKQVLSKKE
jgi:hypothetical protein